jgi:hypothetical protein
MTEAGDRQFLKPISYNLKEDFFNGIGGKQTFVASRVNVRIAINLLMILMEPTD